MKSVGAYNLLVLYWSSNQNLATIFEQDCLESVQVCVLDSQECITQVRLCNKIKSIKRKNDKVSCLPTDWMFNELVNIAVTVVTGLLLATETAMFE